jgi:hypothetical protein
MYLRIYVSAYSLESIKNISKIGNSGVSWFCAMLGGETILTVSGNGLGCSIVLDSTIMNNPSQINDLAVTVIRELVPYRPEEYV